MPDSVLNAKKKRKMPRKADAENRQLFVPILILVVVAIIDQLTKIWAVAELVEGQTYRVIGHFFQLKLIYNRGGAMGTYLGGNTFYLISAVIILIFVLYFIYSNRGNRIIAYSMALIAGGAVGNIIDRFQSGKVVDFLDFDFFDFTFLGKTVERWWTFNLADAAITIGIIVLMFFIIVSPRLKKLPMPNSDESHN